MSRQADISGRRLLEQLGGAGGGVVFVRLLAVWLVRFVKVPVPDVARILDVSPQSVWLWVRRYKKSGVENLDCHKRGGRRHFLMSLEEEAGFVEMLRKEIASGRKVGAGMARQYLEKKTGHCVSLSYVYKLLARNGWQEARARTEAGKSHNNPRDNFDRISHPWQREY